MLTTFSGPVTYLTVHGNRAWVGGPAPEPKFIFDVQQGGLEVDD